MIGHFFAAAPALPSPIYLISPVPSGPRTCRVYEDSPESFLKNSLALATKSLTRYSSAPHPNGGIVWLARTIRQN